ncbi:NERD domain-containing protein [Virgibacillus ainsalahensis]
MAQLIKLQDYITRYEWDIYRYPTQFIRLKNDNWKKVHAMWSHPTNIREEESEPSEVVVAEKNSPFAKWKSFIKKRNHKADEENEQKKDDEETLPATEAELKQHFLNRLLRFQLKWATSTITETSFMNKRYEDDPTLKYFLQRFPDTYLLMYFPIFNIKKASVDGEIILINPIGIEIIKLIDEGRDAVVKAGPERTWTVEKGNSHAKILSPIIALKRTEKIVDRILKAHAIEFPIQKTVLSKTNNIIVSTNFYHTTIAGKSAYEKWFQQKRQLVSPLKSGQLKASEALLKHCQTTAVKRLEWEDDWSAFPVGNEE